MTWATVAFKKIQFYSTDCLGWGTVDLPPQHLETIGDVADALRRGVAARPRRPGRNPAEGLVGIRNAAVHLLPLSRCATSRTSAGWSTPPNTGTPALFLYDRYPGGLGFAEQRLRADRATCCGLPRAHPGVPLRRGCPSCVGLPILRPPIHTDPDAGGGFPIPTRRARGLLLEAMLAGQEPVPGCGGARVSEGPVVVSAQAVEELQGSFVPADGGT